MQKKKKIKDKKYDHRAKMDSEEMRYLHKCDDAFFISRDDIGVTRKETHNKAPFKIKNARGTPSPNSFFVFQSRLPNASSQSGKKR